MSPFIIIILKECFGSYIAQVKEKPSWHQCGWTDLSMLIAPALHCSYIMHASDILVENFSFISIFVRMSLNGQMA